jgi:2-polyprenyl-3-methyl-5-hydroxy-6-metoxy-1,4-benzoquinol methylase
MKTESQFVDTNKKSWDAKVDIHVASEFYNNEAFVKGETSLKEIELELLGDVRGLKILHLQCHFGQDSISLSRMGAEVTGVDFSPKAIETAKELAMKTGQNTQFICTNVYNLPEMLNEKFDLVFTSYGTIGWLPDLSRWANVISHFLKPNGKFVFVEFHPAVWMFDDDFSKVAYNYFNTEPIFESETGSYADRHAGLQCEYVMWNHGLAEVLGSLLDENLLLRKFQEYDFSPYNCFKHTVQTGHSRFQIEHLKNFIPMVYSLVMERNN